MTIHRPEDLASYVHSQVEIGKFASEEDAITQAVRLLRQNREPGVPSNPLSEELAGD